MAHLLGAQSISHSFPNREVFNSVTVGISEGDRIGVVGRNGDGKSTLIKILSRQLVPDSGTVTYRGGLRVGFLTQTDTFDPDLPVTKVVVGDGPEYEWAADPKIRDVLGGLVADLDWNQSVGTLSGGQLRRVALARLLAGDHEVIMLDEPTNHLDVDGVNWLANHLKTRWSQSSGGLLVITHDRWFLDAVCNTTWEVVGGRIEPFSGGYAAYVQQRAERARQQAAIEARRQNILRKELAWLGRGAPARTSKPKFRIDAALELIGNEPPPRDSIELAKLSTARLGKDVVDLEDVSYQTPDGKTIFENLTFRLGPADRIGLVGANGAGKTTLIGLLTGALTPTTGKVKIGKTVRFAQLSQDVAELNEHADDRIFNMIKREKTTFVVGKKEIPTGQLVEQLGFRSEELQTPIKDLSGGQRRRFQLLRLMFTEPNVLILDEPTNDLDTDMLAAIEDLLDIWPGTLIVVSHDRYLLERVTDNQYGLLGDTNLRHLPGGVDQYLQLKVPKMQAQSKQVRSQELTGAERRNLEKESARLERLIAKTETELTQLQLEMAEADQSDYEVLSELSVKERDLRSEIDKAEQTWLEVAQKLQQ
ncbi:MAG: glycerophosphodiester phosphodiesterase [Candidatus Aquiluna sp. XM-24bin5]|nr:MAG: glycerophosphodiester phosphodiesterase [Candidatus Aquiluna sp. XM-24bin5]